MERRGWTYLVRAGYVVVLGLFVLTLAGRHGSFTDSAAVGRRIFFTLVGAQFILAALLSPVLAADSITGERRRGTLPFLILSNFKPLHIVVGKAGAYVFAVGITVAATLPLMMMTTLFGGVSMWQVVVAFLCLAATLLAGSALGIFSSTVCQKESNAAWLTLAAQALWLWGLPRLAPPGAVRHMFCMISPWRCFAGTAAIGLGAQVDPAFPLAAAVLVAGPCLAMAARSVKRHTEPTPPRPLISRVLPSWRLKRPILCSRFFWEPSGLAATTDALVFRLGQVLCAICLPVGALAYLCHHGGLLSGCRLAVGACYLVMASGIVLGCTRFLVQQKADGTLSILLTTPIQERWVAWIYAVGAVRLVLPAIVAWEGLSWLAGSRAYHLRPAAHSLMTHAVLRAVVSACWVAFFSLGALTASAYRRSQTGALAETLPFVLVAGPFAAVHVLGALPHYGAAPFACVVAGLPILFIPMMLRNLRKRIREWQGRA